MPNLDLSKQFGKLSPALCTLPKGVFSIWGFLIEHGFKSYRTISGVVVF
jgi:hypothetical protein